MRHPTRRLADVLVPVDCGSGSHGCTACKYAVCRRMGTLMELVRASGRKRGGEGDGLTCNGVLDELDDARTPFFSCTCRWRSRLSPPEQARMETAMSSLFFPRATELPGIGQKELLSLGIHPRKVSRAHHFSFTRIGEPLSRLPRRPVSPCAAIPFIDPL